MFGMSIFCFSMLGQYDLNSLDDVTNTHAKYYLFGGVTLAIFGLIFMCLVCCYWRKIGEAASVIDAAADMLRDTKRLMFVNVLFFVLTILIIVIWVYGLLGLLSMGEITPNSKIPQGKHIKYSNEQLHDPKFPVFIFIMVFGFFWIITLVNTVFNYMTMVSASTYYFSSAGGVGGQAKVGLAFYFATFKNFGSLCYGSMVIALVTII